MEHKDKKKEIIPLKLHTKSKSRLQRKVSYKEQAPITKENFLQSTGYRASTSVFPKRETYTKVYSW
jgi:hypothetical protein